MLSVQGLADRFLYALIIPFIGFVTDVYGVVEALAVFGVTSVIVGVAILSILRFDKVI